MAAAATTIVQDLFRLYQSEIMTIHDGTERCYCTFLVSQGRLTSAPPAAQIAQHIDITFVKKAQSGGCPS